MPSVSAPRRALAAKKVQGVRLGQPRSLPATTRKRIVTMRNRGMTLRAIAEALNAKEIPTAQAGWM